MEGVGAVGECAVALGAGAGAKLAESSRQWKPAPLWLEEKPKLALEAVLGSGGAESIVGVDGASVSMLQLWLAGALSLPAASRALTWKVWVPSASVL